MANTYTLIEAKTLGTAVASVTFSSIPGTYTDLIVKYSGRQGSENAHNIRFNGDSGNNYTYLMLGGDGVNNPSSGGASGVANIISRGINPGSSTSNTFGNTEMYIPNYANISFNKSVSVDGVNETNGTEIYMSVVAGLWSNTSAITSIEILARDGNLAVGSTFYLYGIKNS
jgi:hypothetical protein